MELLVFLVEVVAAVVKMLLALHPMVEQLLHG
jgi:hypothetical protein